jgi:hypothetical protein
MVGTAYGEGRLSGDEYNARLERTLSARTYADLDALRDLLLRVSRLAEDLPEITELDLNPVIAGPDGAHIVDARIKVMPCQPQDPFLRKLPLTRDPVRRDFSPADAGPHDPAGQAIPGLAFYLQSQGSQYRR